MKIICHRGFWWPRRDRQNHASSIYAALSAGWGAEVDVWGVYGESFRVGHDSPMGTFTPPDNSISEHNEGFLFLHLKVSGQEARVREVLRDRRWLDRTHIFYSPSNDETMSVFLRENPIFAERPKCLVTIDNLETLITQLNLSEPLGGAEGVWLEQPDDDWVDEQVIAMIHERGKTGYVLSSELHGRQLDLAAVSRWATSDGICTDFPHLLEKVMNPQDAIVHPQESWWH